MAYFVPPSEHFAGIERVVHELASGLVEHGGDEWDVHVLFASRYDEAVLDRPAYTLHVLGVDRLRGLVAAVRGVVAREDFDVLVCPQVEASVVLWVATRGLRLPAFVTHLHGNPRVEEEQGTRRTRIAYAVFRGVVARRVTAVLSVSPSLQRFAAGSLVRHVPVHYAPNPVRQPAKTSDRPPRGEIFRVVNVGRLSYQKGQDVLLRALARARVELPAVLLTLVGSGPEEHRLRRLSSELGLDDLVCFAGYVTDPTPFLVEADAFVLASRWEGFGVVLVEALHHGLPLLAVDCEFGPADVITDSRLGRLVRADEDGLAAGLVAMSAQVDTAEDVAFRRRVALTYAREPAVRAHLGVLRQVVDASSSADDVLAQA